jgi:hypothetical protein
MVAKSRFLASLLVVGCTSATGPSREALRHPGNPRVVPGGSTSAGRRADTTAEPNAGFFEVTCACTNWDPCRKAYPFSLEGCASPSCPPGKLCRFGKDRMRCELRTSKPVTSCKPSSCPTDEQAARAEQDGESKDGGSGEPCW